MKRLQKFIKDVPTWMWLVLFLISGIFTTYSLRQNNFEMVRLRDALYEADKNGRGVEQALNELRVYVHSHMNTNLASGGNAIKPPIQLKYTYDRLVKSEQQRVNRANDQIYRDADAYCARNQPGEFRQVCFDDYVDKRDVKANKIPPALYQFDFVSPTWSPDKAGWSLVASILFGLAFIASYIVDRWAVASGRRRRAVKH